MAQTRKHRPRTRHRSSQVHVPRSHKAREAAKLYVKTRDRTSEHDHRSVSRATSITVRWVSYGIRNLLAFIGAIAIFVALPGDIENFRPSFVRLTDKAIRGFLLSDASSYAFGLSNIDVIESKTIPISRSSNQYIVFGRYITSNLIVYRDVYFVEQGVYQPLLHVKNTDYENIVATIARDEGSGIYYFEGHTQGSSGINAGAHAYHLTDGHTLKEIPINYNLGTNEKIRWETSGSMVFIFTEPDGSNGRLIFTPTGVSVSESTGVSSIVGIPVLTTTDSGTVSIDGNEVKSITMEVGGNLLIGKSAAPQEIIGDSVKTVDIGGEFSLIRAISPGTSVIRLNLSYRDPEVEWALIQNIQTVKIEVKN